MAGREVREYTNLPDPKEKKLGKGKERVDDEEVTFQRMVSKMQDAAGERGGYLHGRGALDSDDLLYLKEQMEAEEDAERLLRRTEKRAFLAFKKAVADSIPPSVPLALRVEPKAKSGIRQQDLLKRVVEIKPKRQKVSSPSDASHSPIASLRQPSTSKSEAKHEEEKSSSIRLNGGSDETKVEDSEANRKEKNSSPSRSNNVADETTKDNPVKSLLVAYESSDDEASD